MNAMTRRIDRMQRTVSCRWSVPACRPTSQDGRFESYWTCERIGMVPVTPDVCARCAHWTPEKRRRPARRPRR